MCIDSSPLPIPHRKVGHDRRQAGDDPIEAKSDTENRQDPRVRCLPDVGNAGIGCHGAHMIPILIRCGPGCSEPARGVRSQRLCDRYTHGCKCPWIEYLSRVSLISGVPVFAIDLRSPLDSRLNRAWRGKLFNEHNFS